MKPPPRMRALCAVLAIAGTSAGCAGTPGPRPAMEARAVELNHRATAYYRRGEYLRALETFKQAQLLEQSIEREAGMALNWYHLSLVYQQLGRMREAEQALDAVLLDDKRIYPSAQLDAMILRKSILATFRKDYEAADRWLERMRTSCGSDCALHGKILNLSAYITMQRGDAREVLRITAASLAANRDDATETANAHRLQAEAYLALDDAVSASTAANAALVADKTAGASSKIYQDLLLLGRASRATPTLARDYWLRAGDIARSTGDVDAQRAVQTLLGGQQPADPSEHPMGDYR